MRLPEEVLLVVYRPGPEFLVLLRSPEGHGYWHLVAGGVEQGEAPDAAALRELTEETGLERPVRFRRISLELGYQSLDGEWITLHPYSVEAPAGWEPVLNHEHVEYRWCSADGAVRQLQFPEPSEAVEAVARQLGVEA